MPTRPARLLGSASTLLCSSCVSWQSALDPRGREASGLLRLFWLFVSVSAVIWLLVVVTLAAALARRRVEARPPVEIEPAAERRLGRFVGVAVAATVLVVAALSLASFSMTRGLATGSSDPLIIRMRGYQWWWEIAYTGEPPSRSFVTANEMHVPVGRPVRVELSAADVIHSFWVPSLAGKQDLIPGRRNAISFTAERPGIYRGQCAQFCGLEHAHMAFLVIAEDAAAFAAWREAQIAPASPPSDAEESEGEHLFTEKACAACHTVRGTTAAGTLGPDLTHLASRRYIAAGLVEQTRGSLSAWIADPQTLKPGNNMPRVPLGADELRAVSAYMASLK